MGQGQKGPSLSRPSPNNDNDLITTAKASYEPYGVDYPLGPTGRFTNGRNIAD
ncbi:hypothetical protein M569_12340 [Genlisea aurea]|uniref:Uncharacterized protein n=1 Tax=Genlisea aurea TaxID=192259 RepID=S8C6N7_9LAMI|nr:hypothetical protein M569_12340 [Genlisea aurea]